MFLGFTFAALTIPCMIIYLSKPHDIPIVYPAVHSITLQYIDTHIALIDTHTHLPCRSQSDVHPLGRGNIACSFSICLLLSQDLGRTGVRLWRLAVGTCRRFVHPSVCQVVEGLLSRSCAESDCKGWCGLQVQYDTHTNTNNELMNFNQLFVVLPVSLVE